MVVDSESPKLFSVLASMPGKKTLILDKSLSSLISALASFNQLKEHGIESVKWLQQTTSLDSDSPARVLIIARPGADTMHQTAALVKSSKDKEFTLLLVPRRTAQSDQILEKEGVIADMEIKILPIRFIQEDVDLIRVDVPALSFSSPIIAPMELFSISKSLVELQREYGLFSGLRGKGQHVNELAKLLSQMQSELIIEEKVELEYDGLLGDCIVLDRTNDLLTPLLTQLTYEGLLYESYPISGSILELPSSIQSSERKISLGPGDSIFVDLRSENFSNVGPKLSGTASNLSTELDSRHTMKTTTQLKAFVSRIPNLQSSQKLLKVHIELTELLLAKTKTTEFRQVLEIEQSLYGAFPESEIAGPLESLIAQQFPLPQVLRLLCLWSQIHNGLKPKDYESFSTRVLQSYGHHILLVLHHLRDHGLFIIRTAATEKGRGGWTGFSRTWKLTPDHIDERNPQDIGYLYSGYAPLNLRILQGYCQPAFFDVSGSMGLTTTAGKVLGVGSASSDRVFDNNLKSLRGMSVNIPSPIPIKHKSEKILVVVFLGGCTATELAGVRFLAKQVKREVLIVTRGFVSGGELMDGFIAHGKS